MRLFAAGGVFAAVCAAFAQTASPRPEFEVEHVSLSKAGTTERVEQFDGSQFAIRNSTIAELLPFAFRRRENAIAGMPGWFRTERYDIIAKAPAGVTEEVLSRMVQSLLVNEFGLAFHEEPRQLDAFALTVAPGGAMLRKVVGPGYPGCARGGTIATMEVDCPGITLANLVDFLSFAARDFIDRPVVDQTGMKGTYELKLSWTPQNLIDTAGGLTIFDALSKQAGLRLEQRKLPVPVIVIDHAEPLREK